MLDNKNLEVRKLEAKVIEINSEVSSLETVKAKLNEHIVYLQNEIRKRDDLLEASEFGDSNFELVDGEESESVAMIGTDEDLYKGDLV